MLSSSAKRNIQQYIRIYTHDRHYTTVKSTILLSRIRQRITNVRGSTIPGYILEGNRGRPVARGLYRPARGLVKQKYTCPHVIAVCFVRKLARFPPTDT